MNYSFTTYHFLPPEGDRDALASLFRTSPVFHLYIQSVFKSNKINTFRLQPLERMENTHPQLENRSPFIFKGINVFTCMYVILMFSTRFV